MKKKIVAKNKIINRESIKTGIVAGFFGSLCCTIPLLLVIIGVGSIGVALGFAKYRPFFIILGTVFLTFALYRQIKKKYGVCNRRTIKENLATIIIAIITTVIIWTILIYVIAPIIARFAIS